MSNKIFASDFSFDDPQPSDLLAAYEAGLTGAFKDPEQDRLFDQEAPTFSTAANDITDSGEGKVVCLYNYVLKYDDDAYKDAQSTGDCVSHGTRNAVDATRACEIAVKGEAEGFYVKGATEAIYGSRGHSGQGMSCSGAARFVSTEGGILLRQNYPDLGIDLSNYKESVKLGMGWGRKGVPENVKAEAKKHQVGTVIRVESLEQARDLIVNGYGIAACSGLGFSNKRNEEGVSRRQGSWSHCMAWLAVDAANATVEEYGGPLILIQNSWGKFNSGPTRHNQPPGSFWVVPKDANSIIRSNGIFAFSNVNGFPPQELPDWGFDYATAA